MSAIIYQTIIQRLVDSLPHSPPSKRTPPNPRDIQTANIITPHVLNQGVDVPSTALVIILSGINFAREYELKTRTNSTQKNF